MKSPSRTFRASAATLNTIMDSVVGLGCAFLITPLVVHYLGDALYGGWLVIIQFVAYLGILDLHPMTILKLTLAKSQMSTDVLAKRRDLGASLLISALILPIYVIGCVLFVTFVPRSLSLQPEMSSALVSASVVIVVTYAVSNFTALPTVVLEGENSLYRIFGLNSFILIMTAVLDYLVVKHDLGIMMLAVNKLAALVLKAFIAGIVARCTIPWLGVSMPRREDLKRFFTFSGWMFVMGITYVFHSSSQLAMVGIILGPVSVTIYSLTSSIASRVRGPAQQSLSLLRAGTGDLFGRKRTKELIAVRAELINAVSGMLFVVGAGLVLLNEPFLSLWMGEVYFAGRAVNLLIVLFLYQTLLSGIDSAMLESDLAIRERSLIGLTSVLLSLGLGGLLLWSFGLAGFLVGLLAGNMFQSLGFPLVMARRLDCPPAGLIGQYARPLFMTLLPLGLLCLLHVEMLYLKCWGGLVASGAVIVLVSSLWVWFVVFSCDIRRHLAARLRVAMGPVFRLIGTHA